jgi:hypothetical protein
MYPAGSVVSVEVVDGKFISALETGGSVVSVEVIDGTFV